MNPKPPERKQRQHRPTIKDIARVVYMSVSTVSRALADNPLIAEQTRRKIKAVAQKMGYLPNLMAQSLRQGLSRTVGVLLPDMIDTFYYDIYNAISSELQASGWNSFVVFSEEDVNKERSCLQLLDELKVDGIIMCVCHKAHNICAIQTLADKGMQFVFFDRVPDMHGFTRIELDDEQGVFSLVKSLMKQGFRRPAFVCSPSYLSYTEARMNGFKKATLQYHCFDESLVFQAAGMKPEDGAALAESIIKQMERIDVVAVCDDILAIGLIHELQKRGISVPADIAVAGFGGSKIGLMVTPELTTAFFSPEEIGKQAAQQLMKAITTPSPAPAHVKVKARLMHRVSTRHREGRHSSSSS